MDRGGAADGGRCKASAAANALTKIKIMLSRIEVDSCNKGMY
jgi:hypothetical protein